MSKTVNIAWMYPDLLNLHGERGSVQTFEKRGKAMGMDVKIHRIDSPEGKIDFSKFDLFLFMPGEIKTLFLIKNVLESQMDDLKAYIENGGHIIAVGTTGMLFAKALEREDGSFFQGLGFLDATGKERKYVYGDDLHFRINNTKMEIFGSQIQMVDVTAQSPLGTVIYGHGNDKSGSEGAVYKNLIFTNCLGPVFVKNPWWCDQILKDIYLKKQGINCNSDYSFETASFNSCLEFTNRKPKGEI